MQLDIKVEGERKFNHSIPKSSNAKTGVTRKQRTPNFPKNDYFVPRVTHTCVCLSMGKKCSFLGKFGVLCFLVTYVLKFVLLPNHRRIDPLNVVVCVIYTPFSFFSFFFPQEYCKLISGDSVFSLLCMC